MQPAAAAKSALGNDSIKIGNSIEMLCVTIVKVKVKVKVWVLSLDPKLALTTSQSKIW